MKKLNLDRQSQMCSLANLPVASMGLKPYLRKSWVERIVRSALSRYGLSSGKKDSAMTPHRSFVAVSHTSRAVYKVRVQQPDGKFVRTCNF